MYINTLCVYSDLLQDLPDFFVEADRDSVQRSIQTPPAKPLAVSGGPDPRDALWNIQRFYGGQPVPLEGIMTKPEASFNCALFLMLQPKM